MFLVKKKQSVNKENLAQDKRREPRYSTVARIRINGFEGEAVLRNINSGGFRMESRTYAAITVGERYGMKIIPESASNISSFDLEIEVRWVQNTEKSFSSGLQVASPSANKIFDKYVNYVKAHSSVYST
jgi:hypothetical protein